nr:reverse transcriptase domain-containing protein [Tanacetum cinerariifolium]
MGETTEKIIQIKKGLKTTRSRQKSYADKRCKPIEFKVGDRVLLKVSMERSGPIWFVGILEEEMNLLGSEKINSKPSTRTFSPLHRLLPSSVELRKPEFP